MAREEQLQSDIYEDLSSLEWAVSKIRRPGPAALAWN